MPLDSSIPLSVKSPEFDFAGSFQKGFNSAQEMRNAPLETAKLQQGLQRGEQQLQAGDIENEVNKFKIGATKVQALQDAALNLTPENYAVQKSLLESHGIVKPGVMPPQFDPAWREATVNKLSQEKRQLEIQAEQADISLKQAHTKYFQQGGANGGVGGVKGQLIKQYMDATGADFPTAFQYIQSGGATPAPNADIAQSAPAGTGEEYVKSLPPEVGAQVKALAEGRMQFPTGAALKSPYWQQMLTNVSQYDPNFDAVNYNARAKTRADFTSGKSAQNITSLNTAIGHLDSLDKAFKGLKNSDYPMYNAVANAVGREAGKTDIQKATKDVDTKAIAVAGELAKVFRSTGMSQGEIEDWKNQISSNNSPPQNKKVIESAIELLNSRLDAIGEQYNKGMGTTKEPLELLSPKAKDAYSRLVGAPADKIQMATEPVTPLQNDFIGQVQKAKELGYSDAEIAAYLRGKK